MERPIKGVFVDASTRGNPGPSSIKICDINGNVFKHLEIGYSTNNVSEFIALVTGIFIALNKGIDLVYSDSQTALAWVSKKKCNSKWIVNSKTKTEKARNYISRCENLLKKYTILSDGIDIEITDGIKVVKVEKWHTSLWGEIPADFGNKK